MRMMRALCLALVAMSVVASAGAASIAPETVRFRSGTLILRGYVFHPNASGRHPVVVYLHGIGDEYADEITAVGNTYAEHGYVVFVPFRRGQGLSDGQGESMRQRLLRVDKSDGTAAARRLQVQLMHTEQSDDVAAAIAFVPQIADADPDRVVLAGNSFGAALAMMMVAAHPNIKAAVVSATAAQAWGESPEMREALLDAARHVAVPVFLFQAENDFNVEPTQALAAAMGDKPHRSKIYPPYGTSHMDGHHLGYLGGDIWGPDVFPFLDSVLHNH